MFCILLLEKAQEIVINVGTIGFYISVAGVIGTLGLGLWRISAAFNSKADKSYVEEKMEEKMDQDDFNDFKQEHAKHHEDINKHLFREMEQSNINTQKFIQDVMFRIEENAQAQRDFNKSIVAKQDEMGKAQSDMLVKIGKIETSLGILVNDFNNRQSNLNSKRG